MQLTRREERDMGAKGRGLGDRKAKGLGQQGEDLGPQGEGRGHQGNGLGHQWKVLIVVSSALFFSAPDLFIVNIAFPDIERDFGGRSLGSLSWILNAYAIVFAALLVPAGRTADRLGRKRAFVAGL